MHGIPTTIEDVAAVRDAIESIPPAMRNMGWCVSAEIMERWIRSPAWVLPDVWKSSRPPDPKDLSPAHLDQRIVRMSWAMTNPRVRSAVNKLRARMANGAAREVLRGRLAKLGWGMNDRLAFGSRNDNAIQLEGTCQSNREPFGGVLDTIDDLYGGIGRATLKVALIGEARRDARSGRFALHVTHAGFYIRDTYDFNGPQYLGTWHRKGVLNKTQMALSALVDGMSLNWGKPPGHRSNQDFDRYRSATGFGGDFVIYSDVHWERTDLRLDLS